VGEQAPLKVLFAVSSSGGHITPAIALAEKIRKEVPGLEFLWAYQKGGIAERFLKGSPDRRVALRRAEVPFGASWRWVQVPVVLVALCMTSLKLVLKERPGLVVGFGGSSSFFILLFASLFGRSCLIHEQNALPGRANRILATRVRRVLTGFREGVDRFPRGRAVWTGNPVREGLTPLSKREGRKALGLNPERFTILVLGGSQGAQRLNQFIFQVVSSGQGGDMSPERRLGDVSPASTRGGRDVSPDGTHGGRDDSPAGTCGGRDVLQWIHVTGRGDFKEARALYDRLGVRCALFEFSDRMRDLYSSADLAVARAGALTLAELAHFGVGALLVPYPHAGAHQLENARVFAQAGAAKIFEEASLDAAALKRELAYLAERPEAVRQMGAAAQRLQENQEDNESHDGPRRKEAVTETLDLSLVPGEGIRKI